jgi:hypothetical protein
LRIAPAALCRTSRYRTAPYRTNQPPTLRSRRLFETREQIARKIQTARSMMSMQPLWSCNTHRRLQQPTRGIGQCFKDSFLVLGPHWRQCPPARFSVVESRSWKRRETRLAQTCGSWSAFSNLEYRALIAARQHQGKRPPGTANTSLCISRICLAPLIPEARPRATSSCLGILLFC